jgi:Tfp pilus assembly protein PilO
MNWLHKKIELNKIAKQALALSILILPILLLLGLAIIPAVNVVMEKRAHVELMQRHIEKSRRIIASRISVERHLAQLEASGLRSQVFSIESGGPPLLQFQSAMRSLLDSSGISLGSMVPLGYTAEKPSKTISIHFEFTTSWEDLEKFLSAVRQYPKAIRIDNIHIQTNESQDDRVPPPLMVAFDSFAFVRDGGGNGPR